MSAFSKDFLDFFIELAGHNNKDWFDSNRKRYEHSVKKPFHAFVEEMITRVKEIDPSIAVEPKDAIFRINRDIRFSKDKTPYKTSVSAIISRHGKKDKTSPGLYFELGPEYVRLYSGVYEVEKDQLNAIRHHIAGNLKKFEQLINEPQFKKVFGEIRGEKNKTLPPELKDAAAKQELIYNKNFYYFTELPPEAILQKDLAGKLIGYYKVAKPVSDFLGKAL